VADGAWRKWRRGCSPERDAGETPAREYPKNLRTLVFSIVGGLSAYLSRESAFVERTLMIIF